MKVVNLKYEPSIQVEDNSSDKAFQLHFDEQLKLYRRQILISLVKKKGAEKVLADAFKRYSKSSPYLSPAKPHDKSSNNNSSISSDQESTVIDSNKSIRYVAFDVYHHCGHKNYDKLSILVEKVKDDIATMGYFHYDMDKMSVDKTQQSVFRTNCKDCLDRTNLVQGVFAQINLVKQLKELGFISKNSNSNSNSSSGNSSDSSEREMNTHFIHLFRTMWGDNGDAISICYAGTIDSVY